MLIMWNLVILFIVCTSNVLTVRIEKKSSPIRELSIDGLLNILHNRQLYNDYHQSGHLHELNIDSKSNDDVDTEDNSHYDSLKSREIINLIENAAHNKDVNDVVNMKVIKNNKKHIHSLQSVNNLEDRNKKQKSKLDVPIDERTAKQILAYLKTQVKSKKKPRKQVLNKQKLLKLAKSVKIHGDKHDRASLDEYSKIYIILNPQAVQKSNNKDSLSELISKISSLSSASANDRGEVKKDQHYKGFPVKEGVFSRRARRDSKEKYDPKDSLEDSYKQKRARSDHGSGRTAIPYIRHRGDIYERDN